MAGPAEQVTDVLSFGPFRLVASERLLTKDGVPVELGARTLDLLIALVSRPNEIVSKKDLLARIWPDVTVEEGSLRFHIAALRKALGDGQGGARYISHRGRAGLLLRGARSRGRATRTICARRMSPVFRKPTCLPAWSEWSGAPTTFSGSRLN